jgi:hypothetical protein
VLIWSRLPVPFGSLWMIIIKAPEVTNIRESAPRCAV